MNTYNNITSKCLMTFVIFLTFSTTVYAASSCKGQSQTACLENDRCSWINAHLRKDGKKVKAYCRALPKKKSVLNTKKADDKGKKNANDTTKKLLKTIKKADTIEKAS
ncbi:MAG: hypothetical protein ACI9ES_000588 [Oceanospirillaceae bacterium]|jgi:hypothetical protein